MIKLSLLGLKIVPKISELSATQKATKTEKHERGKSRWQQWTVVGRPARSIGRPIGIQPLDSVDRSVDRPQRGKFCLELSVDRLTPRCSLFPVGRPTVQENFSPFAAGRPIGRPSLTAICQLDCRSTGPVDRAGRPTAVPAAQRLFPLSCISDFVAFCVADNSDILGTIFRPNKLNLIMF